MLIVGSLILKSFCLDPQLTKLIVARRPYLAQLWQEKGVTSSSGRHEELLIQEIFEKGGLGDVVLLCWL